MTTFNNTPLPVPINISSSPSTSTITDDMNSLNWLPVSEMINGDGEFGNGKPSPLIASRSTGPKAKLHI